MRLVVLVLARIARALFRGTPVHRSRRANAAYRWLFQKAYGRTGTVRVSYQGFAFDVPAYDITMLPGLLAGDYEQTEAALLRDILEPGMTFVDVGANIGLFSVPASHLVGPRGRVVAVEPEPGNVERLTANLRRNGCANVTVVPKALGREPGRLALHLEDASIGTHSLLENAANPSGRVLPVEVVRLDDELRELGAWADVLKVDVEGFEPYVLQGAEHTLPSVRFLLIEYHRSYVERTVGIDEFASLLAGFPHLYAIEGKRIRRIAGLEAMRYANLVATREPLIPAAT